MTHENISVKNNYTAVREIIDFPPYNYQLQYISMCMWFVDYNMLHLDIFN